MHSHKSTHMHTHALTQGVHARTQYKHELSVFFSSPNLVNSHQLRKPARHWVFNTLKTLIQLCIIYAATCSTCTHRADATYTHLATHVHTSTTRATTKQLLTTLPRLHDRLCKDIYCWYDTWIYTKLRFFFLVSSSNTKRRQLLHTGMHTHTTHKTYTTHKSKRL